MNLKICDLKIDVSWEDSVNFHSTHNGSAPNTARPAQNENVRMSYACHAVCTLSPLGSALTMRFAQNTTSKVLHWLRKTDGGSKVLACHEKFNSSSENLAKVVRL